MRRRKAAQSRAKAVGSPKTATSRTRRILLGISGGIAAYKTPDLVRRLRERGWEVECVLTQNARRFVSEEVLRVVSGNPVHADLFDEAGWEISHVRLAEKDLVLIAPATANLIAKIACGIADDLLTAIVLATRAPIVLCPSMNDVMWSQPVVQENLRRLKARGYHLLGPDRGALACGRFGPGRLIETEDLLRKIRRLLP